MPKVHDHTKLPFWAQNEIKNLRNELQHMHEKLSAITGTLPTSISIGYRAMDEGYRRYLYDAELIEFAMAKVGRDDAYLQVQLRQSPSSRLWATVQPLTAEERSTPPSWKLLRCTKQSAASSEMSSASEPERFTGASAGRGTTAEAVTFLRKGRSLDG